MPPTSASAEDRTLRLHRALAALTLALALAFDCAAELPQQNLELRFRLVDSEQTARDPSPSGQPVADVTVSTRRPTADRPLLQQLQVLNGEWASFRIGRSLPVRWTSAVAGQAASAAGGARGAVVNELSWLQAGQRLAVRARWPGGNQPARVDVQASLDPVDDRQGVELPAASHSQAVTTLVVPLDRWTTFASSQPDGATPARGTLSTEALKAPTRQLFQVLVHAP